jgi:cytochrome c oxidase cbb3-type subunit III
MRKILLIFVSSWLLLAQDPDNARDQQAKSVDVSAGRTQFRKTCGFCHGPDARGASGPDLIHSSLVNRDVGGNLIGAVVRNGRPEKGMTAFQLSDVEIQQIAQFLHSEVRLAASIYARGPGDYPIEKLLVGNAESGRTYFNGEGHCRECHSLTGDLAHIASRYKPIELQTRIAFPSGAKPTVTVTDESGKVFSGEQVYADEFLISLRDKTGWIYTWKRQLVTVEIHNPLDAHEKLLQTYTDKNIHDLFAYLETLK